MFTFPVRVYYEDTDAGGVVYYANYLKYIERARTEYLRQAGFEQRQLRDEHNRQFVVRSAELDYRIPAMLDDEIVVETRVLDYRRASLLFGQNVIRHTTNAASQLLCAAKIKIACVTADTLKPVAIPQRMNEALNL